MLTRNYDIVGTVATAGVLLIVSAPRPLWGSSELAGAELPGTIDAWQAARPGRGGRTDLY